MKTAEPLRRACLAEFVGTFILVFFGTGVVHAAVLTEAKAGMVAVVWAVAVALAIYTTGAISGAHLNPAMTLAFTVFRGFPRRRVAFYMLAQLAGAFCAALLLYGLFHGTIEHFERAHGLVRGCPRSVLSAMVYGEYFPNPGMVAAGVLANADVSLWQAMLGEAVGTAFLTLFVFALTDRGNAAGPGGALLPLCVGLALALNIFIIAPLTQAGFNPARDFGPRLFAWLAGWGEIAIPGPRGGWFTVYILAPCLGALGGATLYHALLAKRREATVTGPIPAPGEGETAP